MALNLHDQRYDDMLYQIVTQIGKGPQGLIGACLGFLKRRTDFFYQAEPGDKMGFPPGYSQQMVYQIFKAYQKQHFDKFPHKKGLEERWQKHQKEQQEKRKNKQSQKAQKEAGDNQKQEQDEVKNQEPNEQSDNSQQQQPQKRTLPSPSIDPKPLRPEKNKEQNKEMKEKKLAQVDSEISTYNGDKTEKYNWSQTHKQLTVQIPIPEGTTAKQIDVNYTNTNLCIKFKGTGKQILSGKFDDRINVQDSLWYIESNKWIVLNLQKSNEVIWKTIIRGDRQIDPKKVDNSKKLEEFDVETQVSILFCRINQGHLNKVLYEQNRRFNGLPTTEQQKSIEKFEQLYKTQNSPFKGQPYDPKHISMQGRSVKAPLAH